MRRGKKGDHKGEEGRGARGRELWKSQDHVENQPKPMRMNTLKESGDFLKFVADCGNRKGLPCTLTPEEIRKEKIRVEKNVTGSQTKSRNEGR